MTQPHRVAIAIVADDLTGALDAAGPFAERGLATRLIVAADGTYGWSAGRCDVLSVTTESRHLGRDEAADRVRATVADVLQLQPRMLFKKLDSTLRGNVATEIAAALEASGRRHAVIAPALPGKGRVMCGGEVYVDGVPLRDTTIGLDTPAPPPRVPLAEALWQADPGLTIHDVGLDQELTLDVIGAPHAYVIDCVTAEDLDRIVFSVLPDEHDVVLAGASGLAEALATQFGGPVRGAAAAEPHAGLTLIVVGSRSPQGAAQVEAMRADAGAMILPAPGGRLDIDRALQAVAGRGDNLATVVVHAQAHPSGLGLDHSAVSRLLATVTVALLARLRVGALVIVGGDTAHAVLEALGARAIDVLGLLMPNVALGAIPCADRRLPLVAKEGDFGDERFLVDVARLLAAKGPRRA
jgi:uncharacterized protein YgbK (DUF1537 family)